MDMVASSKVYGGASFGAHTSQCKKSVDFLPSVCNDIRHHALAFGKRKLKSRLNPHFLD